MNIVVFDTETISLDKPFCYNVGYVISDENGAPLLKKNFVIEQIWHNTALFSTAYYATKRPLYVSAMRGKTATLEKFGYVCREMARDFKFWNVQCAYAYNSAFDERVFEFNCDWFKCLNPFDNIPVFDIRGNAHNFLIDDNFKNFVIFHNYLTESGAFSSTAETVYRYLTNNTEWCEEHTALNDSEIESEILFATIRKGAKLGEGYKAKLTLGSAGIEKDLHLSANGKDFNFKYTKIKINKTKTEIIL